MPTNFVPRPETDCDRCGGTGWIATKGYRFYSQNGRACIACARFASTTEAANYLDAESSEAGMKAGRDAAAAQKAARLARRAARRAAGAEAADES